MDSQKINKICPKSIFTIVIKTDNQSSILLYSFHIVTCPKWTLFEAIHEENFPRLVLVPETKVFFPPLQRTPLYNGQWDLFHKCPLNRDSTVLQVSVIWRFHFTLCSLEMTNFMRSFSLRLSTYNHQHTVNSDDDQKNSFASLDGLKSEDYSCAKKPSPRR